MPCLLIKIPGLPKMMASCFSLGLNWSARMLYFFGLDFILAIRLCVSEEPPLVFLESNEEIEANFSTEC